MSLGKITVALCLSKTSFFSCIIKIHFIFITLPLVKNKYSYAKKQNHSDGKTYKVYIIRFGRSDRQSNGFKFPKQQNK